MLYVLALKPKKNRIKHFEKCTYYNNFHLLVPLHVNPLGKGDILAHFLSKTCLESEKNKSESHEPEVYIILRSPSFYRRHDEYTYFAYSSRRPVKRVCRSNFRETCEYDGLKTSCRTLRVFF